MERDRVTVQEAAQRLGISESGVRKRVQRGQLDSTHEAGRVYVYLDTPGPEPDSVPDTVPDKYLERLENENEFLRDQVRRQQEIIMQQSITLRALTAPQEPQNESESAEPRSDRGTGAEEPEEATERPWWRRWLGG